MLKRKTYLTFVKLDVSNPEQNPINIRETIVNEAYRRAIRFYKDILPCDQCNFHIKHRLGTYEVIVLWETAAKTEGPSRKQDGRTEKLGTVISNDSCSLGDSSDQIPGVPSANVKRMISFDDEF